MLDLAKALGSADQWRILLAGGAPPKLAALLKDLHIDHVASYVLSWALLMFILTRDSTKGMCIPLTC